MLQWYFLGGSTGIVFSGVCLSVHLSVCRTKSRKLLIRNWCNLAGVWKLVTFDLDFWPWELFSHLKKIRLYILNGLTKQLHFQCGDTSSGYLGHGSVSRSCIQGQGHGSEKAVACNSKTTGRKSLGLDRNICYDNTWSFWHTDIDIWHWPSTLTFDIDLRHWPSTLTFDIDLRHWHLTLTFDIDLRHWPSTLTFDIDLWHWHLTLTFDIDIWHWPLTLTFDIDLWHWDLFSHFFEL